MNPDHELLPEEEVEKLVDFCIERIGHGTDLNFPSKTYALGGAGKSIAFSILSNDWFLIELVIQGGAGTDFYIIDTANENKKTERSYVSTIENRIDLIQDLISDKHPQLETADLKIHIRHLADELRVNQVADFIDKDRMEDILENSADPAADTWWVSRDMVKKGNDILETAKGTDRRRAISKAFLYKAQANTDLIDENLNINYDDDYIAIIAGLGGGTGSGMAIDIARLIRQKSDSTRISLFAILPTTAEPPEERSNAFAALSELENISLFEEDNKMSPFYDIVLTPLEKTGYDGRTPSTPELENFDRAYPHVLLAYYNSVDLDSMFQVNVDYSPFTIAIPKVIRYDVRTRLQEREEIDSIVRTKDQTLEIEKNIHEEVQTFLKAYDEKQTDSDYLYDEHVDIVNNRFDRLEQFVRKVSSEVEVDLSEAYDRDDGYLGKIEDIQSYLNDPYTDIIDSDNIEDEETEEEENQDAAKLLENDIKEVIEQDFENIVALYNLLLAVRAIRESMTQRRSEPIIDLMTFILDPEETEAPDNLRERLENISEEIGKENGEEGYIPAKQEEMSQLQEEKEALLEQQNNQRDVLYDEWRSEVSEPMERLEELEELRATDLFNSLDTELQNFANQVETADHGQVNSLGNNLQNELSRVNTNLKEYDIQVFESDKDTIEDDMRKVKKARQEWIDLSNKDSGLLESFKSFIGLESDNIDTETYSRIFGQISAFIIPSYDREQFNRNDFFVDVNYDVSDIQTQIEQARSQGRELILDQYDRLVENNEEFNPDRRYREELEELLESGVRSNLDEIEEKVKEAINDEITTETTDIDEQINQLEDEIKSLSRTRDFIEATIQVHIDTANDVERFQSNYQELVEDIGTTASSKRRAEPKEDPFLTTIDPENKIRHEESLSDLQAFRERKLTGPAETIRTILVEATKNQFTRSDVTGLTCMPNEIKDNDIPYGETEVNVGYISDVFATEDATHIKEFITGESTTDDGLTERLWSEYNTPRDTGRMGDWFVGNGDPWEFSMVVFVQGLSFLDNLDPVTDNRSGYEKAYKDMKSRDTTPTETRHAYRLEQGEFVVRSDTHTPRNTPEKYMNENIRSQIEDSFEKHTLDSSSEN